MIYIYTGIGVLIQASVFFVASDFIKYIKM